MEKDTKAGVLYPLPHKIINTTPLRIHLRTVCLFYVCMQLYTVSELMQYVPLSWVDKLRKSIFAPELRLWLFTLPGETPSGAVRLPRRLLWAAAPRAPHPWLSAILWSPAERAEASHCCRRRPLAAPCQHTLTVSSANSSILQHANQILQMTFGHCLSHQHSDGFVNTPNLMLHQKI